VYRVPKIAGQHPAYIVAALKAYKGGQRSHPSMDAIAASLSDHERYQTLRGTPGTPRGHSSAERSHFPKLAAAS